MRKSFAFIMSSLVVVYVVIFGGLFILMESGSNLLMPRVSHSRIMPPVLCAQWGAQSSAALSSVDFTTWKDSAKREAIRVWSDGLEDRCVQSAYREWLDFHDKMEREEAARLAIQSSFPRPPV